MQASDHNNKKNSFMALSIDKENGATIIIEGELSIFDVGEYRARLIEADFNDLIVDFSATEKIDGAGVQFLISLKKMMEDEGNALSLTKISDSVSDCLKLYDLESYFETIKNGEC